MASHLSNVEEARQFGVSLPAFNMFQKPQHFDWKFTVAMTVANEKPSLLATSIEGSMSMDTIRPVKIL